MYKYNLINTYPNIKASIPLDKPQEVNSFKMSVNRKQIGLSFKADQKKVIEALETLGKVSLKFIARHPF